MQQSNNLTSKRKRISVLTSGRVVPPFQQWYENKFGRRMPIYILNDVKKQLVQQFENETKAIA